jgi:hypothetical protein
MMVAVTLLGVIVLALLATFQQTQRAFHLGVSQVDVQESGRATLSMIAREVAEAALSGHRQAINFYVGPETAAVTPINVAGNTWPCLLQDFCFVSRQSDSWRAVKYAFDRRKLVGALYRSETNTARWSDVAWVASTNFMLRTAPVDNLGNINANFHRVADGIVHFSVTALDPAGNPVTNSVLPELTVVPNRNDPAFLNYLYLGSNAPSFVEIELGVLEPQVLKRYRNKAAVSQTDAETYVLNRPGRVQLFRQRIPIRCDIPSFP